MSEKNKKNSSKSLSFYQKNIENYPLIIFILLSIFLFVVIFRDFIFNHFLFYFKDIGSDTVNSTLPFYFEFINLQKDGEGFFKFWSFYSGMGQEFSASMTLSPFTYISLALLKIFGIKIWFHRIYLYYFFNILPAGIFTFLYFRTLKFSKYTAIIGGLLLEFAGYMLIGAQWGHASRLFNTMLLLLAFEQFLQKKRLWILPIAFYYLSSNMFLLATNTIFLVIYAGARFFGENFGKFTDFVKLMFKTAGLAIIGVLMNAPAAISNFLKMYFTPRVAGDATQMSNLINNPENIDAYLRNVTTVLRFFSNEILGTGSQFNGWYNYLEAPIFYIGIISLITAGMAFLFFNKKQKIFYGLLLIFWLAVAFVPQLRHTVNFFMGNYYKNTIDVFVPVTILFFAMFGLDKIQKSDEANPLVYVVITGILLILLHYPYFDFNNAIVNFNIKIGITIFIVFYAIALYLLVIAENKNYLKSLILIMVIFELIFTANPTFSNREKYTKYEIIDNYAGYNDGTIDAINFIKQQDSTLFFRVEKDYSSGNAEHASLNDAKVQGYFGTTSYSSFNQLNYIEFLEAVGMIEKGNESQSRWCKGVRGVPLLMTFTNVKYFLTTNPQNPLLNSGYTLIDSVNNKINVNNKIYVLGNRDFLPLGYTYDKYLPYNEFMKLSNFKKQEALLNAVIVDENSNLNLTKLDTNLLVEANELTIADYQKMIENLRDEHLDLQYFSHKKIKGKITLSKDKVLFFTIPFDKGWRIYVNGEKQELKKLNIGFSGIYLKAGTYQITLSYIPPFFYLSIIIMLLALGAYIFIIKKTKAK